MAEQEAVWRAISLAGKISKDSPSLIAPFGANQMALSRGDEVWPAIDAVANMFLITGELAGCEIRDIARQATGLRAAGF